MPSCECLVYFVCRGPLKGDPTRREGREEGVDDGFNLFSRSVSLFLSVSAVAPLYKLHRSSFTSPPREDGFVRLIYSSLQLEICSTGSV